MGSGGGGGGKWGERGREAGVEGAGRGVIGGGKSVTIWVRNCFLFDKKLIKIVQNDTIKAL